jgi:hypothetical protein
MRREQNSAAKNKDRQLVDRIMSAKLRLYNKFVNLDIKSLNISEYNQRYLGDKVVALESELDLYGRLLYLSLNNNRVLPENFVLVDYGGGSGLLSFLATEMGIGTVIYNDIYDVSCVDIGFISHALGLKLERIVCGDVDELISYLQANSISIHAITSYDVLEHIYDVEDHFKKLRLISSDNFRIVYASGANPENPRYLRYVKKQQIEAEFQTRSKKWGNKECETLQAYLEERKNIISAYAPDLSRELIEQLARSTRGLIKRDIEKCIDEFRLQGDVSYFINHPTNTCDPYTGSWCEHLMELDWLEQIVRDAGFVVKILVGRYGVSGTLLKKSAKLFLNSVIPLLGRRGMVIAPYFVVYADYVKYSAESDDCSTVFHISG